MKKALIILLTIVSIFALVSCNDFKQKTGKVHLITVGIDYKFLIGDSFSELPCCIEDAKDVSAAFRSIYLNKGIEVNYIPMVSEGYDPDFSSEFFPSGNNIIKQIGNLDVDSEDLIIVYYTGHGGVDDDNDSVIYTAYNSTTVQSLPVDYLTTVLEKKDCRSLVIIDACKIGADYMSGRGSTSVGTFGSIGKKLTISKTAVISSSAKTESSYGGSENSRYTEELLKALGYDAENDKLTKIPKLTTAKQLFKDSVNLMDSNSQNPEMNFNELDLVVIPN